MKVLKKHILKEFLGVLWITVMGFSTVFLLVEIVEKVDDLIEHNVPFWTGFYYFLYKTPFIFCQVTPVAVLLAVLISLGTLNRNGEITAVKAGGVGLLSALGSLIVSGVVISVLVIIVNETITPATNKLVGSIEREWFRGMKKVSFGRDGLWIRGRKGPGGPGGIYNVRAIDIEKNVLRGVTFYELDGSHVKRRVRARTLVREENRWVAPTAETLTFGLEGVVKVPDERDVPMPGLRGPEDLVTFKKSYEEMSYSELRRYTRGLELEGYKTNKYRVELYSKITFPLVSFIMVLVGIPFALKTGRHGGIAVGIGLSVLIGFSFWIVFGIAKSLGTSAVVPPILAAAFPDVLFIAIGVLMFGYVKQ